MPKYKVYLQQYVEQIAEVEVEADDPDEAIWLATKNTSLIDWSEGDDAYDAEAYAVYANGMLVWER